MFCSNCGAAVAPGAGFCAACGNKVSRAASPLTQPEAVQLDKASAATPPPLPPMPPVPPLPPALPPAVPPLPPVSQQAIPEGVKGWSWGAFLLNWIWAIGNRSWIGLLAIIPYVGFIVAIWLGFKGREMAWKNKQWDSFEHFDRVQKKWSRWGVILALAFVVIGFLAGIAVPAYQDYAARSRGEHTEASLNELLQQAEQSSTDAPASDASATIADANVADVNDQGVIDSNADTLPTSVPTVAGTLARMHDQDGKRFVTLDGRPLFSGDDADWQFPLRSFTLSSGREAVLMASSGGRGNSCETLFFFLIADASGVKPTPLFGTCSAQGRFEQRGDSITLTLPRMGGHSVIALSEGNVIEDGQVVVLNDSNDPAQ